VRLLLPCLMLMALGVLGCSDSSDAPTLPSPLDVAPRREGRVVLGSAQLLGGMPRPQADSNRPLQLAEIKAWLAVEEHHRPIDFVLPLGLHAAATDIPAEYREHLTLARIELGRQLFFDKRLSHEDSLSCSGCHYPKEQFTTFVGNHASLRDPAVAFNRIFSRAQFWDGGAATLFHQPLTPISKSDEMQSSPEEVVRKLQSIAGYRIQFERIFGKLDFNSVCAALTAFECCLITGPSPWDYNVTLADLSARDESSLSADERSLLLEARAGVQSSPLSEAARRGAELFFSARSKCSTCHPAPLFTDESFHALGVESADDDAGRFNITQKEADRGAFKTPTLRNVALTGPYMHNGRFHHLEDAVAWVARGGEGHGSDLEPLNLSSQELADLVAFLHSLSSPLPQPEERKLPE
jgi:cytochrome c peroxidase